MADVTLNVSYLHTFGISRYFGVYIDIRNQSGVTFVLDESLITNDSYDEKFSPLEKKILLRGKQPIISLFAARYARKSSREISLLHGLTRANVAMVGGCGAGDVGASSGFVCTLFPTTCNGLHFDISRTQAVEVFTVCSAENR